MAAARVAKCDLVSIIRRLCNVTPQHQLWACGRAPLFGANVLVKDGDGDGQGGDGVGDVYYAADAALAGAARQQEIHLQRGKEPSVPDLVPAYTALRACACVAG